MKRTYAWVAALVLFLPSLSFADYSLRDYGKDCAEQLGVELPPLNCLAGTLVPVTVNGNPVTDHIPERCDKPTLVGVQAACIPGGRLVKIEQTNPKKETVITMMLCRHALARTTESPIFENIAIFQHNLSNDKVCWWQVRKHAAGILATDLPTAYTTDKVRESRYQGDNAPEKIYEPFPLVAQGDNRCISCHDSHLYMRTPYAKQVTGKDEVPSYPDHGRLTHLGEPFSDWNRDAMQPKRIHINQAAYDLRFPPEKIDRKQAPSNYCTSCHSLGKSPIELEQGTCRAFVKEITLGPGHGPVTSTRLSEWGRSFPEGYWMPPHAFARKFGTGPAGERKYRGHFARALAAVTYCCNNPDATFKGASLCLEP